MTIVINHAVPGQIPVHVLIVVVGKYLVETQNLTGAVDFTQEIVDFWGAPERIFPAGQALASVEVLVSDPDSSTPVITCGDALHTVAAPDFQSVNHVLKDWVNRITLTSGAVGFLHWVGHGSEQMYGGKAVILACDGEDRPDVQSGLNWTDTLHWLNDQTRAHPVYCFIDACRTPSKEEYRYPDMGGFDLMAPQRAYVFMSAERNTQTYWLLDTKQASFDAGCRKYSMGTQAFLLSLESFGARHIPGAEEMPITAAQLLEATAALLQRWAAHEELEIGRPEGPRSSDDRAIMMTATPRTAVDVKMRHIAHAASCDAAEGMDLLSVFQAETKEAPFQFRLARKPHRFRLDGKDWGQELELVHPHVDLYDANSY